MRSISVCVVVFLSAGTCLAVPQLSMTGPPTDNGNGTWTFSYELSNYGGTYYVYDIDWSQLSYGWIYVDLPPYWESDTVVYNGPMSRFTTNQAPCNYEQTIGGFHITAGTPIYGGVMVTYTDVTHNPGAPGLYTGMVQFPTPEPASLSLLVLGGLAVLRRRRR